MNNVQIILNFKLLNPSSSLLSTNSPFSSRSWLRPLPCLLRSSLTTLARPPPQPSLIFSFLFFSLVLFFAIVILRNEDEAETDADATAGRVAAVTIRDTAVPRVVAPTTTTKDAARA